MSSFYNSEAAAHHAINDSPKNKRTCDDSAGRLLTERNVCALQEVEDFVSGFIFCCMFASLSD